MENMKNESKEEKTLDGEGGVGMAGIFILKEEGKEGDAQSAIVL